MSDDSGEERPIDEVALEWLLRMEDPSPQERAEYWDWLNRSPLHVQAVLKAKASLASVAEKVRGHHHDQSTQPAAPIERRVSSFDRPVWKIAASVAFLAVAVTLIVVLSVRAVADRVVDTEPSEWETIRLADGSVVQAGPLTQLATEFTDSQRTVRLKRGEAMFRVAKDAARPFIVETDQATARAIGTAFAVSLLDSRGPLVTVEEGVVAVARREGSGIAPEVVTLRAGQQVHVTSEVPLIVQDVDLRRELDWVTGLFVFETETVAEAAREFNLRNSTQIRINDPELAGRAVRGVFDAAKPHAFADFLERRGIASVDPEETGVLLLIPHRGTDN